MALQFAFAGFSITQDEGEPFWRCSVTLAEPHDAFSFRPRDRFQINLMGEIFEFLVDSVSISRSAPTDVSATVEGVGIGAELDVPRASALTKVWSDPIFAHDVVVELLAARLASWELVNWVIPSNRLSVENGSAVELAKQVVEAAGGVLESYPNGEFLVRRRFPKSPLKYDVLVHDVLVDEVADVALVTFNFQNSRYCDWVRVRDVEESGGADTVEIVFDDGTELAGTLRVYPRPWRPVHVEHTGPADLVLTPIGEVTRLVPDPTGDETEELVEIFEGKGTTRYPVVDLVSIRWQSKDLMGLYFDPYSTEIYSSHPTNKFSLVYLTYHTRSINYRVESPIPQEVQFLVVED